MAGRREKRSLKPSESRVDAWGCEGEDIKTQVRGDPRPVTAVQCFRARMWVGLPADALCARALAATSCPAAGFNGGQKDRSGRSCPETLLPSLAPPRRLVPPARLWLSAPSLLFSAFAGVLVWTRCVCSTRGEAFIAGRLGSGASPGTGTLSAGGGTWAGIGSTPFRATPLPSQCMSA